jgi:hypothetical protein
MTLRLPLLVLSGDFSSVAYLDDNDPYSFALRQHFISPT